MNTVRWRTQIGKDNIVNVGAAWKARELWAATIRHISLEMQQ